MAASADKPQRKTRGDGALRVYRKLREDILSLELPPGELLDEVKIGQRFNLSRSPVREALIRLASDGLVRTLPNKSTMVAPLNIEAFPQYLDALERRLERARSDPGKDARKLEPLIPLWMRFTGLARAAAEGGA